MPRTGTSGLSRESESCHEDHPCRVPPGPRDLLSTARIDGANEWQVFRRVALPPARPVIALVVFVSFVGDWNNFFLP
jgi:Binding-protein-dependent transport system inner membrane component